MRSTLNHVSFILCLTCATLASCALDKGNPWAETREARSKYPSMVKVGVKKVPEHLNPDALEITVEVFNHDVLVFTAVPTIAENRWLYLVEGQDHDSKYGFLEGRPFPDVPLEVLQGTGDGIAALLRWVGPTSGGIELDLRLLGFDGDLELWNITRKLVGPDRHTFLIEPEK